VTAATDTNATIELLEAVFSVGSVQRQPESEVTVRQSPPGGDVGGGGIAIVGSRCVATPKENIDDFVGAVANCELCKLVKQL
jgi:hypothetical protein